VDLEELEEKMRLEVKWEKKEVVGQSDLLRLQLNSVRIKFSLSHLLQAVKPLYIHNCPT